MHFKQIKSIKNRMIPQRKAIAEIVMTYENKLEKFVKHSHPGIAGIIVALILIAVAVVGGISVFMFTQGFMSEAPVTAPMIDVLQIVGSNATDSTDITTHTGTQIPVSNAVGNTLADGDQFTIYVRSKSVGITVIDNITVFGSLHNYDTDCTAIGDTAPQEDTFCITVDGSSTGLSSPVIQGFQEFTIIVGYDIDVNGLVKIGRMIPVTIIISDGVEFNTQVISGTTKLAGGGGGGGDDD